MKKILNKDALKKGSLSALKQKQSGNKNSNSTETVLKQKGAGGMNKGTLKRERKANLMKRVVNNYPQISRLPPPVRRKEGEGMRHVKGMVMW